MPSKAWQGPAATQESAERVQPHSSAAVCPATTTATWHPASGKDGVSGPPRGAALHKGGRGHARPRAQTPALVKQSTAAKAHPAPPPPEAAPVRPVPRNNKQFLLLKKSASCDHAQVLCTPSLPSIGHHTTPQHGRLLLRCSGQRPAVWCVLQSRQASLLRTTGGSALLRHVRRRAAAQCLFGSARPAPQQPPNASQPRAPVAAQGVGWGGGAGASPASPGSLAQHHLHCRPLPAAATPPPASPSSRPRP